MYTKSKLKRGMACRVAIGCCLLFAIPGCDTLSSLFNLPVTTVRLVNNSDFVVRVTIVYADDSNLTREQLEEVGQRMNFTLAVDETTFFTRWCNDMRIVAVEEAELLVFGGGPQTASETLREGTDYECRDLITFTFDHSGIVADFAVMTSVEKP